MKDYQKSENSFYTNMGLSLMFFAAFIWGMFPAFYGMIPKDVLDNVPAAVMAWLILFRTAGAVPCFVCMIAIISFFRTSREERQTIWCLFKRQRMLLFAAALCLTTCRWFDYKIIRSGGSEYVTFACVFSVALVYVGSFAIRLVKIFFFGKKSERIRLDEIFLSIPILLGALVTVIAMQGDIPLNIGVFQPFLLALTSATVLALYFDIISAVSKTSELTLGGKILLLSLQQGLIHLLTAVPWGMFLLHGYMKNSESVISAFSAVRPSFLVIFVGVGVFGTAIAYFTEALGAALYQYGNRRNTGVGVNGWLSIIAFADPLISLSLSWLVSVWQVRRLGALEIARPNLIIIPIVLMMITILSAYKKERKEK
ncbi:hypothetical protein [Desulfonema magnum]|uniref:Uncharacterized protein n=1 Tax=Desulfonema magnum TaxID=45655 RepID=A0A975BFV3_9BACT|nr:hypothetical protein [Desulfonema magnum]QTA84429.1 Uncharacterized protein dnm_004250 [Desulfonema magnum]